MGKYHVTVRLLHASTWCQILSIFCSLIFWLIAIDTGKMVYGWNSLYHIFQSIAVFLIIVMMICIAKGWTIVRASISPAGCLKLVAFITIYGLMIIFAENYAAGFYEYSRSSSYFYHSSSGQVLLVLRCGVAPVWLTFGTYPNVLLLHGYIDLYAMNSLLDRY
jgi:hypothetical protein